MPTNPRRIPIPQGDAEAIANQWHSQSEVHLAAYTNARELCQNIIAIFQDAVLNGDDESPIPTAQDVRSVVSALKIAIDGERKALGMDYLDANRAIERTKQLGFIIQRPDGTLDVDPEYLP